MPLCFPRDGRDCLFSSCTVLFLFYFYRIKPFWARQTKQTILESLFLLLPFLLIADAITRQKDCLVYAARKKKIFPLNFS